MKVVGVALIIAALSCSPKAATTPKSAFPSRPAVPERPGETLALRVGVLGEARVKQRVSFQIRLVNVGTKDVDIVPPLDGSDVGFRYPLYTARILGPDGKLATGDDVGRCGNVNAFRQEDLVVLRPDEELDPLIAAPLGHWLSDWVPKHSGRHVLTLTVDLSADEAKEWCGPESSEVRESAVHV